MSTFNIFKTMNKMNFNNLFMDEQTTSKDQIVFIKIWYYSKGKPETFLVQTENLPIEDVSNDNIILDLTFSNYLFFEEWDKFIVSYLKKSGIVKKYQLKNLVYKTIVNELDGTDSINDSEKIYVLKLNKRHTRFYDSNKHILSSENVSKILVRKNIVKCILELNSIVIDLVKEVVVTDVVLKQALIRKPSPRKIELTDYSFIDSDDELNQKCQNLLSHDVSDIVMNTQTEYLEPYLESKDDNCKNINSKNSQNFVNCWNKIMSQISESIHFPDDNDQQLDQNLDQTNNNHIFGVEQDEESEESDENNGNNEDDEDEDDNSYELDDSQSDDQNGMSIMSSKNSQKIFCRQ